MDSLRYTETLWLEHIRRAAAVKNRQFNETATRLWQFYGDGDHKFMFKEQGKTRSGKVPIPEPSAIVTVNLTAEYVRMMLPFIHNKAPNREVTVERPPLPPDPQGGGMPWGNNRDFEVYSARLQQWALNRLANANNLRGEGRVSCTEGMVKGRGLVWHGLRGDTPVSTFGSVDELFVDPDSEKILEAGYIIRRRRWPAWKLAERFGVPVEMVRGTAASHREYAVEETNETEDPDLNSTRDTKDLVTFYEVYSRIGIGHRFNGTTEEFRALGEWVDQAGPNVYLVILPGFGSPVNLPAHLLGQMSLDEVRARLSWPIRFHECQDPWPCSMLDFYPHPRRCWPSSPLEPAVPLQEYMNWAYSLALVSMRSTCRKILVADSTLNEQIRDKLAQGEDFLVITADNVEDVKRLITVVDFPDMPEQFFRTLQLADQQFRQSTGLVELMYGSSGRQMRSSAEAQIRQQNMSIRPEDMADIVEDWHKRIAIKEAVALRMETSGGTVARWAGEPYSEGPDHRPLSAGPVTQAWLQGVHTDDPAIAASQYAYGIEAGTGRRKNIQKQLADVQEALQFMFQPALQNYQMTGDPRIVNGLIRWWSDAHEVPPTIAESMLLPSAPPPQPQPQ